MLKIEIDLRALLVICISVVIGYLTIHIYDLKKIESNNETERFKYGSLNDSALSLKQTTIDAAAGAYVEMVKPVGE